MLPSVDGASESHIQPQSRLEEKLGPRLIAEDDNPEDKEFKEGRGSEEAVGAETSVGRTGVDKFLGKKSDIKRAFRQTALVKDLRMFKEKEKKRRSMLIYGTVDMKTKLFERDNTESKKKRKGQRVADDKNDLRDKDEDQKNKEKKSWKEYFFINPKDRIITYFDSLMLIVIAYSCFMSMYFAAFEFPIENDTIFLLENICTIFFVLEIITQFMRIPENNENHEVKITHTEIAKRYFRKGAWVYEWAATLPLYLF